LYNRKRLLLQKKPRDKKIAIVGNANLKSDQSALIDSCDFVVRFNNCRNYGNNSGTKVSAVCITNTTLTDIKDFDYNLKDRTFHKDISEIWFPRSIPVHKRINHQYDYEDASESIVEVNNLHSCKIVHFSDEMNENVFRLIRENGKKPFICPSSGILAIEYILGEDRFKEYNKFVFGFNFYMRGEDILGWYGHPWRIEKKIVLTYAATRDDFSFTHI